MLGEDAFYTLDYDEEILMFLEEYFELDSNLVGEGDNPYLEYQPSCGEFWLFEMQPHICYEDALSKEDFKSKIGMK